MSAIISKLFRGLRTIDKEQNGSNGAANSVPARSTPENFLTHEEVDFYREHGYLRMRGVFTAAETDELQQELERLIQEWAFTDKGWTGPWRRVYMDAETEEKSKLVAMHDLQLYSEAWCRALTNSNLTIAMSDLLGPNVELHH